MAGVLYIVENATVMHSLGMDGVLYCSKSKNWEFIPLKYWKKVQSQIYFMEKTKIKYDWGFFSVKKPK